MPDEERPGGESTLTVVIALVINLAIAVMKLVAGLVSGSAAMLSEAAHSIADTFTELFLLTALRRSDRPADRRHPFGYGKERYFWSLLAAVSIFASGALFAFYEGFRTVFGAPSEQESPLLAYIVLALAFVLESVSWTQAIRQTRREAAAENRSIQEYLSRSDDTTAKTVLYEDSAALVGLVIAFLGVLLHQITGSNLPDGIASLLIGLLLAFVAYLLGRTNATLLIGRQADPVLVFAVRDRLAEAPEVEAVVDLLTMTTGTDSVLLCARLDFDDALGAADLERACVRIDGELRAEFHELNEIFLEPVPRTDPDVRAKVLARYGRELHPGGGTGP
ncbi:cation diffusion facilitator family transporter [Actinocrispum wychmicini]|uniref:Cation diffusion facilitator family transporter n=1 Tax=Actinocrispum wychmicini TaxID=1213861 RepID=A0A4R2K4R8_9PSEU|nr:cation diffusion facilitator family transporter [Actinocrispum wychmicini]TCO64816.1 cation diffusion facilitator family transporter [Actinocrispum wychmicini]